MAAAGTPPACPENSFSYNSTLCACSPGYLMDASGQKCTVFKDSGGNFTVQTGVDYSNLFPQTLISFERIKRFTQSQALFLWITGIVLLLWLGFCVAIRFAKVDEGKSVWFKIRWKISRMDVLYSRQHWLADQKPVMRRKTELGGMFSVASVLLFLGLLSALLYQIITRRTMEVQTVRPANAPELAYFANDMEFNLTAISSMTCSHLRGLGSLLTGTPGFLDQKIVPLSDFVNSSCSNTSLGPTLTLTCNPCRVSRDDYYISWQFVDLPSAPATAVGFLFNLTARRPGDNHHVSFVSGVLTPGDGGTTKPATFRGEDVNLFGFQLFPRSYRNVPVRNLNLTQPLFHEFFPGSYLVETSQLQSSLQNSTGGLINMTIHIRFVSDYIVMVDNANIIGPVTFLGSLGGLFAFSVAAFVILLWLFEARIKKLQYEDLRKIKARQRAQKHWDKLRKYVKYRWGTISDTEGNEDSRDKHYLGTMMTDSVRVIGSRRRKGQQPNESIVDSKTQSSIAMIAMPEVVGEKIIMKKEVKHEQFEAGTESTSSTLKDCLQAPPPVPDITSETSMDLSEIQRNLKDLHDYNIQLREQFLAAQTVLGELLRKGSLPS